MTCHNCQHSAEIARLREICVKCRLSDIPTRGTTSLDAVSDSALFGGDLRARPAAGVKTAAVPDPDAIDSPPPFPDPQQAAHDAFVTILAAVAEIPFDRLADLRRIVNAFDGITEADFDLVKHFLNGGTMTTYARAFCVSRQVAHSRCKNLFRRFPVFASIANGLLGKLKGGRKAAPRVEQPDLFDLAKHAEGTATRQPAATADAVI